MSLIFNPVFVGGMYKSGTTLIRSIIQSHPSFTSGLETYWFDVNLKNKLNIRTFVKKISFFYDLEYKVLFSILKKVKKTTQLIDEIMYFKMNVENKKRWVEKTPANIFYLNKIFNYWKRAKYIHIIRDPRDVYISNLVSKRYKSDRTFLKEWFSFQKQILKEKKKYKSKILIIRYEDLILDKKRTYTKIFNFLNEKFIFNNYKYRAIKKDYWKVYRYTGKTSKTLESISKSIFNKSVMRWKKTKYYLNKIDKLEKNIKKNFNYSLWSKAKYKI